MTLRMKPNLELERQDTNDHTTVCPMCKERDSHRIVFTDASGYVAREIHICQPCPCVWFDYYSQEDTTRLTEVVLEG